MSAALTDALRRTGPIVLGSLGVVTLVLASIAFIGSHGSGFDYRAYDLAARRIASGQPLYLIDTVARYTAHDYADLYLYPPQVAIAFVPLTIVDEATATAIWFALRLAALVLGCAVLPVRVWVRIAILGIAGLSFPVLYDLNLGNVSLVVFALSALLWRLGDRPIAGVVLAALITIRYPFGAVGLAWLAMRRWRLIAVTAVTGLVLIALALPIVGVGGYVDYLTILRTLPDISTGPDNLSFAASLRAAGVDGALAALVGPITLLATALFAYFVARRRDADTATVVALTATLLLSPFFHPHYLVALLLPAALLADRGRWWGVFLPLLGWLPGPILPLVALLGLVAPLAGSRPATLRSAASVGTAAAGARA